MGNQDGKSVVIVGGSSGLGLETGARVLVTGRTQATLGSARENLGENAIAVQSDASSLADIDALAERVKSEFVTLDALFVNAGISAFAPFEATSEQIYDEVFAVNT